MSRSAFDVSVQPNQKEITEAVKALREMGESLPDRWLKQTLRRNAKPIEQHARANSPSKRLVPMISRTVAKKRVGPTPGVLVGVIKNDTDIFPKFSAQALASVLEHGTPERFRKTRSIGLITGKVSTGKVNPMPFLRPAYDLNIRGVITKTEESITKKVMKEA